jgi:hypothetical protein
MAGRLGRGHSVSDQCEGGAQLLVVELWPAGVPSLHAGSSHAVAGSLGDRPSLEFWNEIDLGSRSLGTHMGKPLKNRRCLSRDRTIWACANLRDGVKIIDFPFVSARHAERSRTYAMHWSRHRSLGPNTDEFSRCPNQEVWFFLGLGIRAVRPGPEGPRASLGYNNEISRVCLCTANSGLTGPSNASVLSVPTTSIQKPSSFLSVYCGTKDLGAP